MERKYYFRGLGLGIVVTAIIMGAATSHSRKMTDQEIIARAKELGMVENTVLADMDGKETGKAETSEAVKESLVEDDNSGTADEESVTSEEPGETEQAQADDGVVKTDPSRNGSGEVDAEGKSPGDGGETAESQESGETDAKKSEDQDRNETDGAKPEDQGLSERDKSETMQGDGAKATEDDEEEATDGKGNLADRDREVDKQSSGNENGKNSGGGNITVRTGDGSHTVAKKLADAGIVSSADDFDAFLCQNGYDKKLRTGTFYIPSDADDEQIAKIITGVE
ncbi:MAG: hypothetical protein K2P66_11525 [Lachnospiraceae bacterium]|nr:hypothetical protein [Lachnospiraceae bacterium]